MATLSLLEDALGTTSKVRILKVLSRTPDRSWTGHELAREIGMSPNTVHRALDDLASMGVVDILERPSVHEVSLAEESDLVRIVRELFRGEAELRRDLIDAIREAVPPDVAVVLFGSFARGEAGAGSDLDLCIVAPSYDRAAEAAIEARDAARRVVPLPVRTISFVPSDLRRDWDKRLLQAIREDGIPASVKTLEDFL